MGACCVAKAAEPQPAKNEKKEQKPVNKRDEYEVTKTLGVGASCQVLAVQKKGTQQKYAMKTIQKRGTPEAAENESLFRNEVKILQNLKHPNIIEYVESFEDANACYLITVFCSGGELFDKVSEGVFSERVASRLTRQMLLALQHCHERNISHRDLKPENFVFSDRSDDSPMKLIDFGCAIQVGDEDIVHDVAGSPYYVAPEVLQHNFKRTGRVWKAADMWSIGVIVFLLVHGYPPFNGEKQEQIFQKIKIGKYKFSKDIPLSDSVKDLINKLLVMKPEKRISASEALAHPWIAQAAQVAPDVPISAAVVQSLNQFRAQCRLKKAVARVLANRMTDEDKKQLELAFKKYDLNGDGRLGPDEIAAMMKSIGRNEADAKEFMQNVDENNDGVISRDEFAASIAMGKLSNQSDIEQTFKIFDKDGDGFVSAGEIEKVCNFLSPEAVKQLISDVDQNGDGKISFKEWVQAMGDLQAKKLV